MSLKTETGSTYLSEARIKKMVFDYQAEKGFETFFDTLLEELDNLKAEIESRNTNQSCDICDGKVLEKDKAYTEDALPAHKKCLDAQGKHWEERDEAIDLMGH